METPWLKVARIQWIPRTILHPRGSQFLQLWRFRRIYLLVLWSILCILLTLICLICRRKEPRLLFFCRTWRGLRDWGLLRLFGRRNLVFGVLLAVGIRLRIGTPRLLHLVRRIGRTCRWSYLLAIVCLCLPLYPILRIYRIPIFARGPSGFHRR